MAPEADTDCATPMGRPDAAASGNMETSRSGRPTVAGRQPPLSTSATRALLGSYQDAFDAVDTRAARFGFQQALTRYFLTNHVRASVVAVERALHAQISLGEDAQTRKSVIEEI